MDHTIEVDYVTVTAFKHLLARLFDIDCRKKSRRAGKKAQSRNPIVNYGFSWFKSNELFKPHTLGVCLFCAWPIKKTSIVCRLLYSFKHTQRQRHTSRDPNGGKCFVCISIFIWTSCHTIFLWLFFYFFVSLFKLKRYTSLSSRQ